MIIKRITVKEMNSVVHLFDQYRVFYKQVSDIVLAQQFIAQRLHHNESVIFVAFNGDLPVGFTQLYPTYSSMRASKNWILNDLYVSADYRKQGIGAALIDTAMNFAREDGAAYLALSTAVDNYTAQSLYEAIGFVKQQPDTAFFDYRINLK